MVGLGTVSTTQPNKSPARGGASREADSLVKLGFQLLANNSSQANQPGSEQSECTRLRNGSGDDRVATAQGHRSGKPALAGAKGNLCGRAIYSRPGVPSAGDSTGQDVIDGTVRPWTGHFGPGHWTTE